MKHCQQVEWLNIDTSSGGDHLNPSFFRIIIIGSGNCLIPVQCQVIPQTNDTFLSTVPLQEQPLVKFNRNSNFSLMKIHFMMYTCSLCTMYHQTSHISRSLVDNKMVDHWNVVGGLSLLLQPHLPKMWLAQHRQPGTDRHPTTFQWSSHSQLDTWLQWIGQRQLQDETRNIWILKIGVAYIRGLTVPLSAQIIQSRLTAPRSITPSRRWRKIPAKNPWLCR